MIGVSFPNQYDTMKQTFNQIGTETQTLCIHAPNFPHSKYVEQLCEAMDENPQICNPQVQKLASVLYIPL